MLQKLQEMISKKNLGESVISKENSLDYQYINDQEKVESK